MPFQIGNKKLIPAPFVTINKSMTFANDGSPINSNYSITLEGTLLPNRGSPTSTTWWTAAGDPPDEAFVTDTDRFNSLLAKQELLKQEFAGTGYQIQYSPPGDDPVYFYPKLLSINFPPGNWVIKSDYQIQLEAPEIDRQYTNSENSLIYGSGYANLNLTSVSDSYQIREREDGSELLEISRTISANAAFKYGPSGIVDAWENARTWVNYRKANFPFSSGIISISTGVVLSGISYNFFEDESIDRLGGQYSINQRFIWHYRNYNETRTVSRSIEQNLLGDGGPTIERINVNGNIQGLDVQNTPSGKYIAASSYWSTLYGNLPAMIGAYGSPTSFNLTENKFLGTIDYSVSYVNNSGSAYRHTYDVAYSQGTDVPTVTINGSIEGVTPDALYNVTGTVVTKFDRAVSGWNVVSGSLYSLAFTYPTVVPSGNFSTVPISRNTSFNKANGTVNYTYTYTYTSGSNINYQNFYSIELDTVNGPANVAYAGAACNATINGQIIGLSADNNPTSKVNNAKTGWTTVQTMLFPLVQAEFSLIGSNTAPLNSGFVRRTVGTDYRAGSLSYSAAFNNLPSPSSTLVAVENVTVEDVNPQDIFAVQIIPGRMSGPIIQNIATVSERRRNINIALTMYPKNSAPYYYGYGDKSIPANIASGIVSTLVPPGIRGSGYWFSGDTESWDFKAGLYTRNTSIVF